MTRHIETRVRQVTGRDGWRRWCAVSFDESAIPLSIGLNRDQRAHAASDAKEFARYFAGDSSNAHSLDYSPSAAELPCYCPTCRLTPLGLLVELEREEKEKEAFA